MIRVSKVAFLSVLFIAFAGCASEPDENVSPSTSSDEIVSIDGKIAPCPAAPPRNGSSCDARGLECSWGDDARFGCRTQGRCGNDLGDKVWQVSQATCPEPASTCPANPPISASSGDALSCGKKELGLTCVYGERAYTCTPCSGTLCFQDTTWSVTDLAEGCPSSVPNFGDACATPHLYCNYNVCADDQIPPNQWAYGIGMKCDQGEWQFYGGKEACL